MVVAETMALVLALVILLRASVGDSVYVSHSIIVFSVRDSVSHAVNNIALAIALPFEMAIAFEIALASAIALAIAVVVAVAIALAAALASYTAF